MVRRHLSKARLVALGAAALLAGGCLPSLDNRACFGNDGCKGGQVCRSGMCLSVNADSGATDAHPSDAPGATDAVPDTGTGPVDSGTMGMDGMIHDMGTVHPDAMPADEGVLDGGIDASPDATPADGAPDATPLDAAPDATPMDAAPDATPMDATPPDTGIQDATPDTGIQDATPDTGIQDATPDTGIQDALPDTGVQDALPDAQPADSGVFDTGIMDSSAPDALPPDTGTLPLSVTLAGSGAGSVTIAPDGGTCNASCTPQIPIGATLTLTAQPNVSSQFQAWSQDCTGTGACNLTMTTTHAVTATFLAFHTLSVTVTGPALGTGVVTTDVGGITCDKSAPPTCTALIADGTVVHFTQTITGVALFTGWGGACSGTGACTVTMTADMTVSASFTP